MPRGKCRVVNSKSIVADNINDKIATKVFERIQKYEKKLLDRGYAKYCSDLGKGIFSNCELTPEALKQAGKYTAVFIKK